MMQTPKNSTDAARVVTRFAPSPSGQLHVGGARTALFCWTYARGRQGTFIVRIEDTDRKRSSDASALDFLQGLRWMGIDWDEGPEYDGCGGGPNGPYFQSQRTDLYQRFADRLVDEGKAYRAFETAEELDAARAAARADKRTYRYDRAALQLDDATVRRYVDEGRPHVIRFRLPDREEVVIHDELAGDVRTAIAEMDDFVIVKADGYPTYHFAVVVDDEHMGVSHVIRGKEHLGNTARHALLQEALGFRTPVFAHVSTITNPGGSKMSKRDKDKFLRSVVRERGIEEPPPAADGEPAVTPEHFRWWLEDKDRQLELPAAERLAAALQVELPEINVEDFRRSGYLPEVLVNYLALLGWSPGDDVEKFDEQFLLERFDVDRLIKSDATFDREKLLAFNLDALQAMDVEQFTDRYREHCSRFHPELLERLDDAQFRVLAAANHSRAKTLDDTIASSRFFIIDDDEVQYAETTAVRKVLAKGDPNGYQHLERLLPELEQLDRWTLEELERVITAYAEAHAGGKLGKVAQPLRVAVSGTTVSPAIFDTLLILGQTSVCNRIRRCLTTRPVQQNA
ncbi:MAG: glutamate--tRNA ligase [Planctomycetota bacterium]|jgi:glutamyl-tRNA synthetase